MSFKEDIEALRSILNVLETEKDPEKISAYILENAPRDSDGKISGMLENIVLYRLKDGNLSKPHVDKARADIRHTVGAADLFLKNSE